MWLVSEAAAERTDETNTLRRKIRLDLEDEIWDYFDEQGGQVVIYDANNGNVKSRKETRDKFEARGVHVIFLGRFRYPRERGPRNEAEHTESQCDKEDIITANIRSVKLSSPDVSCHFL
jgi:6-phosphofructo-2-kinase/fructose-2,6-biphosphatase 4